MNDTHITPDDPRLTAFALGELDGEDAQLVAAAVAHDPALQAVVDDMRAMAGELEGAFASETLPEVAAMDLSQGRNEAYPLDSRKIVRFPYFWVSGLMAAGFAVLVMVQDPESPAVSKEQVLRYDLDLTQMPTTDAEDANQDVPSVGGSVVLVADSAAVPVGNPSSAEGTVTLSPVLVEISREDALRANAGKPMGKPGLGSKNGLMLGAGTFLSAVPAEGGDPLNAVLSIQPNGPSDSAAPLTPPERVATVAGHAWLRPSTEPSSSFAVNVDPAGFAQVRRMIADGQRPSAENVRIEEMLNAFTYDYRAPAPGEASPVAPNVEVATAPWAPAHQLVRVGLKAREANDEMLPSLIVAEHLKIQVEFNPLRVAAYRLIGYEDRDHATRDSSPVPAEGEAFQAGQAVTALYEIVPHGVKLPPELDGSMAAAKLLGEVDDALLVVHVQAQAINTDASAEWSFPLPDRDQPFEAASEDFRFAAAVAGFGLVLRDSPDRGTLNLVEVRRWADQAKDFDPSGQRQEFIVLIDQFESLMQL